VKSRGAGAVLTFIDLVQDFDVVEPYILAIRDIAGWPQRIVVSRWLAEAAPRVEQILRGHGVPFDYVRRRDVVAGRSPRLDGVRYVLTASESSAAAHTAGWALASRARAAGIPTATFQHGLQNVALSPEPDGEWLRLASDRIFCWSGQPLEGTPAETLQKRVAVGRTAIPGGISPTHDLGVFENLHWSRYDDDQRQGFLRCLLTMADRRPALSILVRAHPAGGWLDSVAPELERRPNLTLITSAQARRSLEGGRSTVSKVGRIITTPSTVALDAAMSGRPVALAIQSDDAFVPLPLLAGPDDWLAFADGALDPVQLKGFLTRHLLPGDAIARTLAALSEVSA
jgi:hypothetical protein